MPSSKITRAALLAASIVLLFAAPARAAGGFPVQQPLTTLGAHHAGVRASAPTSSAVDRTVEQLTGGLDASQVSAQSACDAPKPGQAACFARTLVERGTHRRIRPHVHHQDTFTQVFPSRRKGIAPAAAAASPMLGAPNAGTPAWLQQAYDLTYLSQTAGTGQTVAIVDAYDSPNAESDLATYRSYFNLPPCTTANGCFKKLNQSGQQSNYPAPDSGWTQEISLDVDAVSALCPNCKIVLVEANSSYSTDLSAAIQTAVNAGAKFVSNSYGAGESSVDPWFNRTFAGVSLTASTGDNGTMATGVAAYPAAIPGVVAVGGTTLALSGGAPTARGFGESAWSGAGSGCTNQVIKPSYQADAGCTGRSYADVSADADPNTGLYAYDGGWFLVGGTSLASPLVAAFEAVTGITDSTPKWVYDNSALLNDPVSGSNGSCPIAYICNAATGYDGPTGMGSISGAVTIGAPGVAAPSKSTGYMQTASASTASLAGGVYPNSLDTTYSWQYGTTTAYGSQTAPIDIGAGKAPVLTTSTLTGLLSSTTYHYRLVATNSAGTSYGYDYTFTTASAGSIPPANTAPPVISGTPQQGQTLSVSSGTWNPAPSAYAYQWQRSTDGGTTWTPISGATATTYVPGAADLGAILRAQVTASNAYGANVANTASVGPITSGAPGNTGQPVISGTPRRGQILTVSSSWNPAGTISYQWQRSTDGGATWVSIGTNATSYTLVAGDVGGLIRVVVTAGNTWGSTSATAVPVGPVTTDPPGNTAAPQLTGTTQRTYMLSTTRGSWNGTGNTYTYAWQRSADGATWTTIPGAASANYTLGVADEGGYVRAQVTATNSDGTTTQSSDPTADIVAPYPPANTVAPTISGNPQRASVLTATRGTWTGPDNVYSYQWQRDAGEGYTDIANATGSTYTLTVADENATVRVVVKATNPDAAIVEASQPTTLVQDAGPLNANLPAVTGTPQRGSTLNATAGSWSGIGNTYAFQWQNSADGTTWTNISGATTPNYNAATTDEGKQLRVVVTATNPDGSQSAASAATTTVLATPPVATGKPTLTGTVQRGYTLSATQGTWTGINSTYAYQWQRDSGSGFADIAGATGTTYALGVGDEGARIRVVVTGTNVDGTGTGTSDPTTPVAASAPIYTAVPQLTGTPQRAATMTGSQGTWTGIGNAYSYQWQSSPDGTNWTNIGGATSTTYTITVGDEGTKLRLIVIATNVDGMTTAASAPTATIPSAPPVNTSPPSIAGTAQRAQVLTAQLGVWNGIGNVYGYQWQRDSGAGFVNIAGATSASYTIAVADENAQLRLVITATNPDGTATATSTATATVPAAPPANSARPTITGSAVRSTVMTSTQGTWSGIGNVYAYQWQRDSGAGFVDISGATSATYVLAVADEGAKVRLQVTATNPDGAITAVSDPTAVVAASPALNLVAPAVTGNAQRAQTLSGTQGTWSGAGNAYTYQWQRSDDSGATWQDISGEVNSTYTLTVNDVGRIVRLKVTATNADGAVSATSPATATVGAQGPLNTARPVISGSAARASVLTATQGTWSGAGNAYTYQWQASPDGGTTWNDIRGATDSTYTLALGDEGSIVRAVVTATNPDGATSAASNPSASIRSAPPVNSALPAIGGTAQRSYTLSVSQGTWTGAGNTYTYQWQHDTGSGFTNIGGAIANTYALGVADEGSRLRVVVTATNPDATVTATTTATASVASAPPGITIAPSISGAARRGTTLQSSQGTWTGIGNSYGYQWQRDAGSGFVAIAGATSTTYTLAPADIGARVRLVVTASNPDGSLSSTTSPTGAVQAAPPVNTGLPTIAGTPTLTSTLTAAPGTWSPGDATYSYAWQRNTGSGFTDIPGATDQTYGLVRADVGFAVRVRVTATNVDGTAVSYSAATATVAAPPVNLVAPAAPAGTARQGSTLTADDGTWDGQVTYAYTWLRCPANLTVAGAQCTTIASGPTLILTDADVGHPIAVKVTATSAGGATSAYSALTSVVTMLPLQNVSPPQVVGAVQVPKTVSADPGTWNLPLDTVAYTWRRCDADGINNCVTVADGVTHYTLTAADEGQTIVLGAAVSSGLQIGSAHSVAMPVSGPPVPRATGAPTITGSAVRGTVLAAGTGNWSNSPTQFAYQWRRCDAGGDNCADIAGATGSTYALVKGDEGATIVVAVTAQNANGTTTATSGPTATVAAAPPVNTHRPVLLSTGTVAQGATLTMTGFTWNATADTSYAYSWQRCDNNGGCATITGAGGLQYTLMAADVGKAIIGVVTATNPDGAVNASSDPTAAASMSAPRWKTLPTLSGGTGRVNDVLTLTPGVFTGPPVVTDTTELMRCTNACVARGTSSTYTVGSGDVGSILRVRETASNAGGDTVVWSTRYVGPVINATSAAAVLGKGPTALKNAKGQTLATATLPAARASKAAARAVVTVKRSTRVKDKLTAWACEAKLEATSAPDCSAKVKVGKRAKLKLPAAATGQLRVVIVEGK